MGTVVAPQDVLVLIPEPGKLTLRGRRDLADQKKLKTWRRKDCPTMVGLVSSQGALERRQESPGRAGDREMEVGVRVRARPEEAALLALKMEDRARSQGTQAASNSWKRQGG